MIPTIARVIARFVFVRRNSVFSLGTQVTFAFVPIPIKASTGEISCFTAFRLAMVYGVRVYDMTVVVARQMCAEAIVPSATRGTFRNTRRRNHRRKPGVSVATRATGRRLRKFLGVAFFVSHFMPDCTEQYFASSGTFALSFLVRALM